MIDNPVVKSLNRPMTIAMIPVPFFVLGLCFALLVANCSQSLLYGVLTFAMVWILGMWAKKNDPEILGIIVRSFYVKTSYDPKTFKAPRIIRK